MVFTRFVEVGRVVLIKAGPFVNKLAVIVEILDHSRVLIDGPQAITGVTRQVINLKQVDLTSFVVANVTRGMLHNKLCLRFEQDHIVKRFAKTAQGKAIERFNLRSKMTDFDAFRVNKINRNIDAVARAIAFKKSK
ncbi:60S ribosomal protein L14, putative [Entamoeba invadens IP1]|uniref:60S ribosomal protein L14, putative n=1 Tax=Entamoeba invadens IP1 TaxID=370355 RepID=A0A0A1TXN1_ENTIV|nr:60S ribosomal protein L14, putative [Entamoeba invadens IP1]ELP84290.1 60S ribosomal protein L14, putative [Entamoeba invadens IP1]|eukprot:XP_004183636.1 60S ribosomal protein L14, putative [Entamoeba invadens IP1]